MSKVFVPASQAVFDVYGAGKDPDGTTYFIIWNHLAHEPGFEEIDVDDCVPYDGEIMPDVAPRKAPKEEPVVVSAKHEGETYEPSACDCCGQRFECFPQLFLGELPMNVLEELKKHKVTLTSDADFKAAMDTVAKSRERVFALKNSLENQYPGVVVKSIGVDQDLDNIEISLRVDDPKKFYGEPSGLGDRMREKIKADAEKRSAENVRGRIDEDQRRDPRGDGIFGPGSERL